jgi:hypothetical protein
MRKSHCWRARPRTRSSRCVARAPPSVVLNSLACLPRFHSHCSSRHQKRGLRRSGCEIPNHTLREAQYCRLAPPVPASVPHTPRRALPQEDRKSNPRRAHRGGQSLVSTTGPAGCLRVADESCGARYRDTRLSASGRREWLEWVAAIRRRRR